MNNVFSLKGKSILVTGASSGIGKQIAITCADNGARVLLAGRDEARLKDSLREISDESESKYSIGDLAYEENLNSLCEQCFELEGLVLNAGMVKLLPVSFIKKSDLDLIFEVNIKSTILLVQKLLKAKKIKKGASIVFISSISTQKATVGNAMYNASKGAMNAFAKTLALELAPRQIRVNIVLPGFVHTNILGVGNAENEDLKKHRLNYPMGRFGEPKDIAYLVQYLLSDASEWMTGSLIPIDGGFSLK
ncbi:MAG: SDR family oxidoreductase [Bacteroidetes bacterium]|nr:MAG: SDR family oxidoreductase [Bacteroidota bacterium]